MHKNIRSALAVLHDVAAAALAWAGAYLLRFNFELPPAFAIEAGQTLVWVVLSQGLIFWSLGLYRGVWRYASVNDLRRIVWAVILGTLAIPLMFWMARFDVVLPRSVLIIYPLLLLILMGGGRLTYRLWKEQTLFADIKWRGEPVLILGAGDAAVSLARELARNPSWRVVGFLDDDEDKSGTILNGVRVLGRLDELANTVQRLGVSQVIVAMPGVSHRERRRAIGLCGQAGVRVLTVPAFDDLLSGRVSISQLRAVELDDLLGRDPVRLDEAGLLEQLSGKIVLVTGAGGSIGSELCRQIARFSPRKLLLLDAGELALYSIGQEMSRKYPNLDAVYLAGDVRDAARLEQVFSEYRPVVVFHAAAYKHVPLMESENAWQAVRNNVYGTWCVAACAQRHCAEKFVLISTDKAVNPTNVMGATKRLAEMVCQGLQSFFHQQPCVGRDSSRLNTNSVGMNPDLQNQSVAECAAPSVKPQAGWMGTKFIVVRFGNVLGSTGSVIPKFREQIASGGPLTVTHPDITRYFMTIPEAAQLVMQAGYMGKGGEIFVLDMGEPVRIVDLARDMIRLSGLSEDEIKIEFIGLRPGEKLYEELLADDENTLPTPHRKLRIAQARPVSDDECKGLLSWVGESNVYADEAVRARLKQWIPEYAPAPTPR
ncbi:MAG: polysaccharide biosynthesis protein [Gallionellaceae bacterium CG11_big_fil_rev_8_21_14_0_20_60_62]|nr:MAG: polysaccharide biosynthesis protein [Gallionellaceae bacterium CG11_big_fil_rev_8_21_14_0_20_60_62]